MNYKQIVERISLIRSRKNIKPKPFGEMLGNSETYFYKIENQSITLSVPKLLEVLELLEIETEEFFYNDLDNFKQDKEMISLFKSLSSENKEMVVGLMKSLKK